MEVKPLAAFVTRISTAPATRSRYDLKWRFFEKLAGVDLAHVA